jgi:hypothetical protein
MMNDAPEDSAKLPWETVEPSDERAVDAVDQGAPLNQSGIEAATGASGATAIAPAALSIRTAALPLQHDAPSDDIWTIPLLAAGIALIACCLLVPLGDANRRLGYERQKLAADLEQLDKQVAVNEEFVGKVSQDPVLAQRLALRQMKVVKRGTAVLELASDTRRDDVSPFLLVNVPPPPAMRPYRSVGGRFAQMCRDRRENLYMLGAGMLMVAVGLVCGGAVSDDA